MKRFAAGTGTCVTCAWCSTPSAVVSITSVSTWASTVSMPVAAFRGCGIWRTTGCGLGGVDDVKIEEGVGLEKV